MGQGRIVDELKHDTFGCVELVEWAGDDGASQRLIRRIVGGGVWTRWFARLLARREARVLEALRASDAGFVARHHQLPDAAVEELSALPTRRGERSRAGDVFLRPFAEGEPLHRATALPLDFFDLLEDAAVALHAAGVCHNDLHKEQNVIVGTDGRPVLIDFQLATLHPGSPRSGLRGGWFRARCRDDMRHLQKHRRRYTRDGRGPEALRVPDAARMRRRGIALVWMKTVKPVYKFVTRKILRTRDGEEHRPTSGPWPEWGPAVGPVYESTPGSETRAHAPR